MSYIKRNVNTVLLLIVVLIIASVAGLSTYYQKTYKNLSMDFQEKIEEVETLADDLEKQKKELNSTQEELDLKKEREKNISLHRLLTSPSVCRAFETENRNTAGNEGKQLSAMY